MVDHIGRPTERSHRILHDLADTLGCSVEAFLGKTRPEELAMTEELLSLWSSIGDLEARQRILDCARAAKDEDGTKPHA
ncbi:hypothetical protein MKL01_22365 [Methylobacterium sp. J-070]|nr:hypothetical protein [Methylobacterium sp. J-070]